MTGGTFDGARRCGWLVVAGLACLVAARSSGSATGAVPPTDGTPSADAPRGHLLLLGGGEEPPDFWPKFFELAGGKESAVVIVPTASGSPETGGEYADDLRTQGAKDVTVLEIRSPDDAARREWVAVLRRARGIFFTGGDQSRITRAFLGSAALAAVREAHRSGAVVAGTSAGLACMSATMITGEGDFTVLRSGAVETAAGLGFVTEGVLDQHFLQRQRLNRLLSVVLERPNLLGIGVDQSTGIWIRPDRTFTVLGVSGVVVLDATSARVRGAAPQSAQSAEGVLLHVLAPGDRFDLAARRPLAAVAPPS
jgi:cyanophycinase